MGIATTLAQYLAERGVKYDVVGHPQAVTASESAKMSHVALNRLAKAVVLKGEDGFMLAVLPASSHIQFGYLRKQLGADVDLANEEQIETLFVDCENAIVWIDHRVARIFYLGLDVVDQLTICADLPTEHLHHKANTIGSGKVQDDPAFFPRIDEALQNSESVLVVGPGNEKTLLLKHLKEGPHAHKTRDLHAQPCDDPTDHEIIALGRHHFHLGEPAR